MPKTRPLGPSLNPAFLRVQRMTNDTVRWAKGAAAGFETTGLADDPDGTTYRVCQLGSLHRLVKGYVNRKTLIMKNNCVTRILGSVACCVLCFAPGSAKATETIVAGMIGAPNAPSWPWYIGMERGFFAEGGDYARSHLCANCRRSCAAAFSRLARHCRRRWRGRADPRNREGRSVALLRIIGQISPYATLAKPGITSIKDLKGKTICIAGPLDINRVYLERIMQANGLRNGDYDITVVGNTAGRFAALKSGAVDATMLTPPAIFFAEDAGFRNVGMILDYTKDLPFSAMDVSLAYARTHREYSCKAARSHRQECRLVQ